MKIKSLICTTVLSILGIAGIEIKTASAIVQMRSRDALSSRASLDLLVIGFGIIIQIPFDLS